MMKSKCKHTIINDNDTGEVYATDSFFIKKMVARFVQKVSELLDSFDAITLRGLDIGTAEGQLLSILIENRKVNELFSVELELQKIQTSLLRKYDQQFIQGDAHSLCFLENTFDFVMATEILEHLPFPKKALAEICCIAKPNAPIIISVPYEPFFHLGNLARGKYWGRGGKTPTHLHFWNKSEFEILLGEFVAVKKSYAVATFPWLLYFCHNKK